MTPAEHVARAEHLLDRCEASTDADGALLAIGHAVVAWVRWECGLWEDADTAPARATGARSAEQGQGGPELHRCDFRPKWNDPKGDE